MTSTPIDPLSGSAGTPTSVSGATATGAGASAGTGALANPDMFLKLMIAQLKYQNPLQPTDGAAFLAQTAQFSTVEMLQQLVASQTESSRWQRTAEAQGLIGHTVDALDTSSGDTLTGTVTQVRPTVDGPKLTLHQTDGTDIELTLDQVTVVRGSDTSTGTTTGTSGTAPTAGSTTA